MNAPRLPCDRRSDEDRLVDLNAALDERDDAIDLIVGLLWSALMWSVIALVVLS